MVGMAIGAGLVARARRVAWTGALMSGVLIGIVGLIAAVSPEVWGGFFTSNPAVLATVGVYFAWAGPAYGVYGAGLCLYFAAQGSGRILGPVLRASTRLLLAGTGAWLLHHFQTPLWSVFALIAFTMVAYGLAVMIAVRLTDWTPRR
ncbi:MAG: MATE family efflux transporter [Burkholderiaceae bacterium]